jgi:hypothetical protein
MPLLLGNTAASAIQDIVRSSLVAYYDASVGTSLNQNIFPNPLDPFAWFNTTTNNLALSRDTVTGASPAGGTPMKMQPTGSAADPHIGSYNGPVWNFGTAQANQTFTVSFWAKTNRVGSDITPLVCFPDSTGGVFVFANQITSFSVFPTGTWARYSGTVTAPNDSRVVGIQLRLDASEGLAYTSDIQHIDGIQVEAGPTMTTLNTNSRDIWYDISGVGSSKNLTLTSNIPKYYTGGKYLAFNGSSHKAENTTMSGVLSGLYEGSVCVMYRSTATDTDAMVWDFCNTNGNRDLFSMRQNWSGVQTTGYNATGGLFGVAQFGASVTGAWKHFAFVRRSNVLYAYVNGVLNQTGSTMADPIGTINKLIIGQDNIGTNFINGDFGHFMAYNKGLTQEEVQQNFNYFRGQYGL